MSAEKTALLKDLLSARRSVRSFSEESLVLDILKIVLYAGQGRTSADGKRTAPSAHALYPLTLKIIVRKVEGLASGLYAFDSDAGELSSFLGLIDNESLSAAVLGDEKWLQSAPAVIVIVAQRDLAIQHFAHQQTDGLRGARYVDFEAGAAVQNIYLAATAAGLGGVVVMGFDDMKMNKTLRLAPAFFPVAFFCLGHPSQ